MVKTKNPEKKASRILDYFNWSVTSFEATFPDGKFYWYVQLIIDIFSRVNFLFCRDLNVSSFKRVALGRVFESFHSRTYWAEKENQAKYNEDISILAHKESPSVIKK